MPTHVSGTFTIPEDASSGIYAFNINGGGISDTKEFGIMIDGNYLITPNYQTPLSKIPVTRPNTIFEFHVNEDAGEHYIYFDYYDGVCLDVQNNPAVLISSWECDDIVPIYNLEFEQIGTRLYTPFILKAYVPDIWDGQLIRVSIYCYFERKYPPYDAERYYVYSHNLLDVKFG